MERWKTAGGAASRGLGACLPKHSFMTVHTGSGWESRAVVSRRRSISVRTKTLWKRSWVCSAARSIVDALTFIRETSVLATTVAVRVARHAPPAPEPDAEPAAYARAGTYSYSETRKLRYSGLVGETSVEVRGAGSVVVNIIDPGREIEVVTADSRTRIRLDEPD